MSDSPGVIQMDRRTFFAGAVATMVSSAEAKPPEDAAVEHIIPTVNHERILVKASFQKPQRGSPRLMVDRKQVEGLRTDSTGYFWSFDVGGLRPDTQHGLRLVNDRGRPLSTPWKLKTFPEPGARPEHLRVLVYTCAGGNDRIVDEAGQPYVLSLARRRGLLQRGLSFEPDAVIANGDHVYWDLRSLPSSTRQGANPQAERDVGRFNRSMPIFGYPNEGVLLRAAGPQIAALYGTMLRGTPSFFVTDDHDYFDNDDADDKMLTFPPDPFMLTLARATRRLYYPEFLPDPYRPLGLPGSSALDTPPGTAENYGTLRYGDLAEFLMYDCRRFQTLAGPSAVFVAEEAEKWMKARMAAPEVGHVVNVPSLPPGWTAGKWGEWYPDFLVDGRLTTQKPKPYWQTGWEAQHDRILAAVSQMAGRIPLMITGDLHAIGEAQILRTRSNDLRANPVISVLAGPIGTGKLQWPTGRRGTPPRIAEHLEAVERQHPLEENGFTVLDITRDGIVANQFKWNVEQPDAVISTLQPFRTSEMRRDRR